MGEKREEKQYIGYETVIFQVFIMEEIRKVKYKVGQKFMVEMREGYHFSRIVRREIEICRIDKNTRLIWIKFPLVCGGYREMFGYERELDSMIIT